MSLSTSVLPAGDVSLAPMTDWWVDTPILSNTSIDCLHRSLP